MLVPPIVEKGLENCKLNLTAGLKWIKFLAILEMRRHYSSYFKGFPNIKPYREKLVTTYDIAEILGILDEIQNVYTRQIKVEQLV